MLHSLGTAQSGYSGTAAAVRPGLDPARLERLLRIVIVALSVIGLGIATYLTIVDSMGDAPVCVGGSAGCKTVAASPYAELAGVRVSVLGMAGYAAILLSALVPGDAGRLSGVVLALTGAGFSAYLTYVELFVIHAVCQWCVASAVVLVLLLVASGARLVWGLPPATKGGGASPRGPGPVS